MGRGQQTAELLTGLIELDGLRRPLADDPGKLSAIDTVQQTIKRLVGELVPKTVAARLLGVSVTTIDKLAARGLLPTARPPGSSRQYIPRDVLVPLVIEVKRRRAEGQRRAVLAEALRHIRPPASRRQPEGHSTAERRSLAMHRLIAERLDQRLIRRARRRVQAWLEEGAPMSDRWVREWQRLLERPPAVIASEITRDDQRGRDLRQSTPFAGAISQQERLEILRRVH
jgi:DNA-binding transcriptional MerR regulator